MSRTHATLERLESDWTIADEGLSRNGTWVNGERVRPAGACATATSSASAAPRWPSRTGTRPRADRRWRRGRPGGAADPDPAPRPRRAVPALRDASSPPGLEPRDRREVSLTVDAVKAHARAVRRLRARRPAPEPEARRLALRALRGGLSHARPLAQAIRVGGVGELDPQRVARDARLNGLKPREGRPRAARSAGRCAPADIAVARDPHRVAGARPSGRADADRRPASAPWGRSARPCPSP